MTTPEHPAPAAWDFTPYEKTVESPERWRLELAAFRALSRTPWVVTEKIHGAHFALVTDGRVVRAAKRKALLDGEDFFGHRRLLERVERAARDVFLRVREAHPTAARVALHGELFGGAYPHPDVAPEPGVQAIQTGVWYSPRVEFCAFDVAHEDASGPASRRYLDQGVAQALCEACGLLYAAPLFVGAFEEALQYPLGFDSRVPARRGLPPLPAGTNAAEGVVAKPARSVVVAGPDGAFRPTVKRKIARFAEDARYAGAEKWVDASSATGALAWLRPSASALANEARFHSARSKLGDAPADALAREVADDMVASLAEAYAQALAALTPSERRALDDFARGEAQALVALYRECGA